MNATRAAAWMPLPVLLFALFADEFHVELPALLLDAQFGLDPTGRMFLVASALLWLATGLRLADGSRGAAPPGLPAAFLLAAAGSLALPFAEDAASFYLASALLTLAGYGLIVERGGPEHRRAARVYLTIALVGEGLLLEALLHLVHDSPGPLAADLVGAAGASRFASALLFAAFGTKAGVALLHVWLPPACAATSPPAAAAVAGALGLAGILGWLRFLPVGAAMPELGAGIIVVGLIAALFAPALGLLQRSVNALLAYWTVANAGFVVIAVGAALVSPSADALLAPGLPLLAACHAAAVGALFLGAAMMPARPRNRRVMLATLAFAGAPLAPVAFNLAASEMNPAMGSSPLAPLLALAAFGVALLMARALWLVARAEPAATSSPAAVAAWVALLAVVLAVPVALPTRLAVEPGIPVAFAVAPILAGFAVAALIASRPALRSRLGHLAGRIPPGDLLAVIEPAAAFLWRALLRALAWPDREQARPQHPDREKLRKGFERVELRLRGGAAAGVALLLVIIALALV